MPRAARLTGRRYPGRQASRTPAVTTIGVARRTRLGPRDRGHCRVTELAEEIGMEQSAVSHQLRLLRNLGLVTGKRSGKHIVYGLYDNHVAMLLDEAVYHSEHLRLGVRDTPPIDATG
jgi:ArsR family transcriptional regulator, nickel/cobalt-responsive transcriptional repressor